MEQLLTENVLSEYTYIAGAVYHNSVQWNVLALLK